MGDKHSDLGQVEANGAIAAQPHLHTEQEVLRLAQGLLQGDDPSVALSLGAEVAVLVASHDGELDAVLGEGIRRSHSEDISGHGDVGGKGEIVEGDSQGKEEAVARLSAR